MRKHGISTTKAEIWVHLFVLKCCLYSYRVEDCLTYIRTNNSLLIGGRSPDGAVTGLGYLIKQGASFVRLCRLSPAYFAGYQFQAMSARDLHLAGQSILARVYRHQHRDLRFVETKAAQFDEGYDALVDGRRTEFKTEKYLTDNLFVQEAEGGHRATQVKLADGSLAYSSSTLPPFAEDET